MWIIAEIAHFWKQSRASAFPTDSVIWPANLIRVSEQAEMGRSGKRREMEDLWRVVAIAPLSINIVLGRNGWSDFLARNPISA